MSRLFDRIYRGKAAIKTGAPGTGLRLAIVKEIMDRHDGRITVSCDGIPGMGTSVIAWLPVAGENDG